MNVISDKNCIKTAIGELVTAECASVILLIFREYRGQVGCRLIPYLLDQGLERKGGKFG